MGSVPPPSASRSVSVSPLVLFPRQTRPRTPHRLAMPSAARSILFALAVLGLAGRYDSSGTTSMVMAAPIAQPSFPVADYSHNVGPASTPGKSMRVKHHESSELSRYASSRSAAAQATSAASGSSLQPRADQFTLLNNRYQSARKNAATYSAHTSYALENLPSDGMHRAPLRAIVLA